MYLTLIGASAGGLAVYLHLDYLSSLIKPIAPKLKKFVGFPDGGFFLAYQPSSAVPTTNANFTGLMQWLYYAMNASVGVNNDCVSMNPKNPHYCIFAEGIAQYIQTPMFALQSQFDAWQTQCIAGVTNASDPAYFEYINDYGIIFMQTFEVTYLKSDKNGVFLDSCHHHCGEWGNITIDGIQQAQAFAEFYNGSEIDVWYQAREYPCTDCCSNS